MEKRIVLSDETVVEAKAFRVQESDEYPQGIKYSFQHYDPESGKTLLRYDNYKEHSGSRDHVHIGEDKTDSVEFENLHDHFRKFMKEVRK